MTVRAYCNHLVSNKKTGFPCFNGNPAVSSAARLSQETRGFPSLLRNRFGFVTVFTLQYITIVKLTCQGINYVIIPADRLTFRQDLWHKTLEECRTEIENYFTADSTSRSPKGYIMAPKKYYAVVSGRKPGIYTSWPEAQAQVNGWQGAKFKGFPTRKEAEVWLASPTYSQSAKKTPSSARPTIASTSPKTGEVTIYTDGGARFNPGPGGYGVVQIYKSERKELSGGYRMTTNNRMELMACIVALRELEHRDKPVRLYSDSSYVVNGITKGWAKGWRKRGWIKSDNKPAINPDLWAELLELVEDLVISFHWVKGHAGHPMNERCDELAVASSRRDGLPEDLGYNKT